MAFSETEAEKQARKARKKAIAVEKANRKRKKIPGWTELTDAIVAGDVDRAHRIVTDALRTWRHEHLLAHGLSYSCKNNHPAVVPRLIALGADYTSNFGDRTPALIDAAKSGHTAIVKRCLESDRHTDNKVKREILRSGLLEAASTEVGELLIQYGAEINYQEKDGKTLLMNARKTYIVELLVTHGVDVEARDHDGNTALMWTIITDEKPDIAKILIEKGNANIDAADGKDRTVLMTAIWKNRIEVLDILISRKVDVHATDTRGRNALHHLASDKKRTDSYDPNKRTKKNTLQLERDTHILKTLLATDIVPGLSDKKGRTCLHWAASLGYSGLLQLLIQTGKFNVNAVERRSRTPLHFAAANGDFKNVDILLNTPGIDIYVESDGDWTVLHCACWAKRDPVAVVRRILGHEAAVREREQIGSKLIQRKLQSGRTSLHVAAERGNLEIVRSLLAETDVKRTSRDAFGNTPLLSGAKPGHENRNEIVSAFAPWKNVQTLSTDAQEATKAFEATIVDFTENRRSKGPVRMSVFDLLYSKDPNDAAKPQKTAFDKSIGANGFRWIHLPANNVSWCLDLFTKFFIEEEGEVDWNSFNALERSFNYQHRGHEPQARYMTPICQTVVRSWGNEGGDGTYDGDAEEIPLSRKNTLFEKNASYERTGRLMSRHASPQTGRFMPTRLSASPVELRRSEVLNAVPLTPDRRARFAPKADSRSTDDSGSVSDFYVFMPYIHFETYKERKEMSNSYTSILSGPLSVGPSADQAAPSPEHSSPMRDLNVTQQPTSETNARPPPSKDHALFKAYLKTSDEALHIRRTLDQSFYHHIDTRDRDEDQVILRFQRKYGPRALNPKILMVDQLWLYVIGKKLIVTSFPQRWEQPKKDPLNVLENILAIINQPNRDPVRSVHELAMIILGRCFGAYDRHGVGSDDPHFLDMFEGWIGAAMEDEVKLFKRFKRDSLHASKWLQTAEKLRDVEKIQEQQNEPMREPGPEEKFITIAPIPSKAADFVQNLLDIGSETELLKEIKDIQDELEMLMLVFSHQALVLPDIQRAIETIKQHEGWSPLLQQKLRRAFDDQERNIQHPEAEIRRMQGQAERMYRSIRDLLDLKQKHANAIEARYLREQTNDISWQAIESSNQGRTLMIFTIFTVIFLPLSFIAALFAIDIDELPHKGGTQVLSMAFVAKFIFGVGAAIAIFFVLLTISFKPTLDWWKLRRKENARAGAQRTTTPPIPIAPQQEQVQLNNRFLARSLRFRGAKAGDVESSLPNGYLRAG